MLANTLRKLAEEDHLRIKHGDYANKIMGGTITLEEYKILIQANFYFHSIVQAAIQPFLVKNLAYNFSKRDKIPYLLNDLEVLCLTTSSETNPNIGEGEVEFEINSLWEAIGAAYVVEGTAIGGAIIRKNLLKNDRFASLEEINFFGCYGKNLSPLWKSFLSFLKSYENKATATDIQASLKKAKETFALYEQLLRKTEELVLTNTF